MAAAYAALVSLFNNLELIQHHHRISFHFEENQIKSLRLSVCTLIDFMQSCDYHGGSKEAAEDLERMIASAAHAAEDVVESFVVCLIRSGYVEYIFDLQEVIENMEFASRKAMQVTKAHGGFKAEQPAHSVSSTSLFSEKSNNTMVGFDDVLHRLLDLLTGEPSSREVIPIVGMGGSGKTTLAINAFQHKLIEQHFDVCLWATISQQYSMKEILLQLLSGQRKSAAGESEFVQELGEQLHKKLCGRRYLVVLDDMWSVEAWDEIQLYLPSNDNKSRIVLTTRQWNVADCFGPSCLKMNLLDEDQSWNLFCEKAFAEKVCPPELEDMGKKIVKKCKGLPLAIVVVGGHLGKSSRMQEYWEKIANNFNSILDSGVENGQCLDILSLSYSYLPVQLKPCFVYMGTFQEDQKIPESELIQLWVAEGFIKSNNNNSEEVAEDYLRDLVERNLIIFNLEYLGGKTFICKIHDLLRELCLKIAEKEKFFHHVLPTTPQVECRVLIAQDPEIIQAPILAPTVRSLKCQGADQLSFDLILLRVQNRVGRALTNEVDVGFLERNLQHVNLRYLRCSADFERDASFHLPPSISQLWSLQTLIIEGEYKYVVAPYEIWEMPQLRHLVFNHIFLPDPHPHCSFDQPLGLRSVQRIVNFGLSEEVCKRIPDIKELRVAYKRVCDEQKSDYSLHNLDRLHELEFLDCSFSQWPEWRDLALNLTFPSSLKELTLTNPHLQWEELTMMVGFLPHLQHLYIDEVEAGPEWNPIEGGFTNLEVLYISNCSNLICWNADSSHFPVLKSLVLENVSKLDNLPSDFREIPTLVYIHLNGCSVSLAMSAIRLLVERREEQGDDDILLFVDFCGDLEKLKSFEEQMQEEDLRSDGLAIL